MVLPPEVRLLSIIFALTSMMDCETHYRNKGARLASNGALGCAKIDRGHLPLNKLSQFGNVRMAPTSRPFPGPGMPSRGITCRIREEGASPRRHPPDGITTAQGRCLCFDCQTSLPSGLASSGAIRSFRNLLTARILERFATDFREYVEQTRGNPQCELKNRHDPDCSRGRKHLRDHAIQRENEFGRDTNSSIHRTASTCTSSSL